MAGGEHPASARGVAALLFLTSGMATFAAYSTLRSSPWTAENVGADLEKARVPQAGARAEAGG